MTREALERRALALIDRLAGGDRDDDARDALLTDILRFQAREVAPYARLVSARAVDVDGARGPSDFPALPTDVFRHVRVASHPPEEDTRVFRTSGTTSGARGEHFFRTLTLYDRAARAAAARALFAGVTRIRVVCLAPSPEEAPDSSLSYMLGRFGEWFGRDGACFVWRDGVDVEALERALGAAVDDDEPVALLGTSFAFAHAEERLDETRFALPPGSRIMETGGYKGRAREISRSDMRAMLRVRYGVPATHILAEYGMTELSSQLYETSLVAPHEPVRLDVPGWLRAVPVDPDSLRPVRQGEVGILRIDDAANVGSVAAIQTSDLARVVEGGIELVGRDRSAVPRGCSLMVEEALGGER